MSYEDLWTGKVSVEYFRVLWNLWSEDPIKVAILRAVLPHVTSYHLMGAALCQKVVSFFVLVLYQWKKETPH